MFNHRVYYVLSLLYNASFFFYIRKSVVNGQEKLFKYFYNRKTNRGRVKKKSKMKQSDVDDALDVTDNAAKFAFQYCRVHILARYYASFALI